MFRLLNSLYGRLGIGLALSVLVMNFGDALIFDRVLLALLILATLVSFAINKDTFSILAIVCLFYGFEEFNWYLTEHLISDTNNVWLKLYCYGLCLFGCFLERHEKIVKILFLVVSIALCFEVYWIYKEITPKEIYWYVLTSAVALSIKYLLFWRPHILHRLYPDVADWTFSLLDRDFGVFLRILLCLEIVMISEYLIRYTTENTNIIYVYNGYPYIVHAINLYLLISAFSEINRNHHNKNMNA